jgi:hypothetical protein
MELEDVQLWRAGSSNDLEGRGGRRIFEIIIPAFTRREDGS